MVDSYFSILGLDPSFEVDAGQLEKRYIEMQQQYHPDRFVMSPPRDRIIALQKATDINAAYETLKDPLQRAEYLLELKGIHITGEQPDVKAGQDILMEAMEKREQLNEAADAAAVRRLEEEIAREAKVCLKKMSSAFSRYEDTVATQLALKLRFLTKFMDEARLKRQQLEG
jgi:molecular chaperone HscB